MPPEVLSFHLYDGYIPIAVSTWRTGPLTVTKRIGTSVDMDRPIDYSDVAVKNDSGQPADFLMYLAVRSLGPAGGRIDQISGSQDYRAILIDREIAVQLNPAPMAFGSTTFGENGDDVSVWAKRGMLPASRQSVDRLGLASGAALYRLHLEAGQTFELSLRCAVRNKNTRGFLTGSFMQRDVAEAFRRIETEWRGILDNTTLKAVDPFGHDMFAASIAYILMNSVGNQLRVAAVSYPVSYLRDGVFMLDALEEAGLQSRARDYLDYFIEHPWTGAQSQQGPEADAPGELCWIIGEHYRFTKDDAWLRSVYPQLKNEADLIIFMRHPHDGEVRKLGGVTLTAKDNRVYAYMNSSLYGIQQHFNVELSEATAGIIVGRLDWRLYAGTTSVFGVAGLRTAWEAAEAVGDRADAETYMTEYFSFRKALNLWMETHPDEFAFGSGIWPTGAFDPQQSYIGNINQEGSYAQLASTDYHQLEPFAPGSRSFYRLFGSAHSLFRMGYTKEVYSNLLIPFLNSVFSRSTNGAYGYVEYTPHDDSIYESRHWPELWSDVRGWTDLGNIMPHGWTGADVALLIRDLLYYEDGQRLVLAGGKFLDEIAVGDTIGVDNGVTYFGSLTYHLTRKTPQHFHLAFSGDAAPLNGYVIDTNSRFDIEGIEVDGKRYIGPFARRIYIPKGTRDVEIDVAPLSRPSARDIAVTGKPIVSDVTSDSATVKWTTSYPALTKIVCGIGKLRGDIVIDYADSTQHSAVLTNLSPAESYTCEIYASAAELSSIVTFTTTR